MSKLSVNELTDETGSGAPSFPNGLDINSEIFNFNGIARFATTITVADDSFAEIVTPGIQAGFVFVQRREKDNGFTNGSESGAAFLDWGGSPGNGAFELGSGAFFDISSAGEPTGTTGTNNHVTIFQGGPAGTFYFENRRGGPDTWLITIL